MSRVFSLTKRFLGTLLFHALRLRPRPFVVVLWLPCLLSVATLSAEPITYTNPVLNGDFPDPSVIRVGQDYWATATTSEWAPLFPILHSRDLVNWELTGSVFQRRPEWSVGNYWAPEVSENKGAYYVYYVGRKRGGPLSIAVATASEPSGPFTDHGPLIGQEDGSIDPVTALDENGERYLIWKEDGNSRKRPTPIWAQKLSSDGTKLTGEMKELLRNDTPWEGNVIEGPFVLSHDGWFYLFYSGNGCCGRSCTYALGVARAKKLLGPWEKNPGNPILRENEFWKCPGHGSIVTDPQGRDFLLYHAYDTKDFVYVGRQGLLDEIDWQAGGWPTINQGRGPSARATAPLGASARHSEHTFFDDFTAAALKPNWQWPQGNEPQVSVHPGNGGWLVLSPSKEHAVDPIGAVLAVKTTVGNYTAVTLLEIPSGEAGTAAGISAYGDSQNALGINIGSNQIALWRRTKEKQETLATQEYTGRTHIYFRMVAREGHRFHFSVSEDASNWNDLGPDLDVEGNYLPPWDRGVRVALTCGGGVGASAKFDWLRIVPDPEPKPH